MMNPICLLKSRKEKIFQGRQILKMVLIQSKLLNVITDHLVNATIRFPIIMYHVIKYSVDLNIVIY